MNKLLSISLSACLLAACSTNNDPLPASSQAFSDVLIQPTAGIAQGSIEAETRAVVNGGTATTPELMLNFAVAHDTKTADPVFYGAYGASFTAKRPSAVGSTATALTTFSTPQYYLANGRKSKMTGWYPVGTYTQGKVVWTIDGDDDVMVAPAKEGSKVENGGISTLAFAHKLAQVQVYAYATDADAKTQWGNITKVELTGQNKTCTYTFTSDATGAVTFSTADNATFTLYNNSTGTAPGVGSTASAAVLIGTAMIEPKASTTVLNLNVTTALGGVVPVPVPAQVYAASSAYKITLKLNKTTISPSATVGGWSDSADKEVGIY